MLVRELARSIWIMQNTTRDDHSRQYPTKTSILNAIKAYNIASVYRCYETVAKYGHIIYIMPPYHREFQSIEKVRSMVKTSIAFHPDLNETLKTLNIKLEEGMRAVNSHQLVSV